MSENKKHDVNEEEITVEREIDKEAFDVITRLYDKTFRELVDR